MTVDPGPSVGRGTPVGGDGSEAAHPIRVEAAGGLRVLTLDRPPLNVLDIAMLEALTRAIGRVAEEPDASVLLLTGAGRAFCAGVDVADHTEDRVAAMIVTLHGALTALGRLQIPTIAALNGATLGGGLEIALACDIVLAREGAKLGQPEIRLGVFPPFAAAVLPSRCGRGVAMDVCLSGRTFPAGEALALGIVQQVMPDEGFEDAARAYARALAGLSNPVLRVAKRAVAAGTRLPSGAALREAERLYLDELMRLDDAREGLAAFLEKRPPVWRNR